MCLISFTLRTAQRRMSHVYVLYVCKTLLQKENCDAERAKCDLRKILLNVFKHLISIIANKFNRSVCLCTVYVHRGAKFSFVKREIGQSKSKSLHIHPPDRGRCVYFIRGRWRTYNVSNIGLYNFAIGSAKLLEKNKANINRTYMLHVHGVKIEVFFIFIFVKCFQSTPGNHVTGQEWQYLTVLLSTTTTFSVLLCPQFLWAYFPFYDSATK